MNIFLLPEWAKYAWQAEKYLLDHFHLSSLASFGIEGSSYSAALPATANLLAYLKDTQKNDLVHINKIEPYLSQNYLKLDGSTVNNLELFRTIRGSSKKGSLLALLDQTHTAMGGRLLRQWLLYPLTDRSKIEARQNVIAALLEKPQVSEEVRLKLKEILDLERLLSRLSLNQGSPRDLDGLRLSLMNITDLTKILQLQLPNVAGLIPQELVTQFQPIVDLVAENIKSEPPLSSREGGFIQSGISQELDELRQIMSGDRSWLAELQKSERQKTGIDSLKIDCNKIYGYYIEVSKANMHLVPDYYVRKQTLVNAERFIIPELKVRENQVFAAEDKVKQLESELFDSVVKKVLSELPLLKQVALKIAELDCLVALSATAKERNYVRPEIIETGELKIIDGRHPVVESLLIDSRFVANDTEINEHDSLLLLITGPNMSGKSTYLRQVALIVLMAHVGSYVPASSAVIPVTDQIFTRVGASDSLAEGQSTFLVEMIETANILNNATPRSLVIFDEVGRGTSTFDGMSIAWAVIEYLLANKNKRPRTLFATHYHELTVLSDKYPEIENMQMAVRREKDEIVFLRRIKKGAEWESYGIEVAKLAGLPSTVVKRAQEILYRLKANQKQMRVNAKKTEEDSGQMELI